MRNLRRVVLWVVLLGMAVATGVILTRRSDAPAAAGRSGDASTSQFGEASHSTLRAASAAESAASTLTSGDEAAAEADKKCALTLQDAEMDDARRSLTGTGNPEHILVAMLLDQAGGGVDSAAQAKLLDLGGRSVSTGSRLLAWHALRACDVAKQSCPIAQLEQRLLELDQQNAEAWALVATLRYGRGDFAGALAAMQGAARAPTATWYLAETAALIERSLAAQTAMSYVDRQGLALTVAAASMPMPTTNMCKTESASSKAWGEACLAFGKRRAEHNEVDAARSFGHIIREQVFTVLGDREQAAEAAVALAQTRAERSAMVQGPAMQMQRLQWELIQADPARLHAYLDAVQQFGEIAGRRVFLRQEVPPLLERAGLLQREGVRECAAHLFAEARPASAGQQARVADELYVSTRGISGGSTGMVRIGSDGKITTLSFIPRAGRGTAARHERGLAAAGKTTAQIQRELMMILAPYNRYREITVVLLPRRSDAELRLEFDAALREAADRRSKLR